MISPYMTVPDVAMYLRCHYMTIYKLIHHDGLPHFKIGTDYRFDRRLIDAWRRQKQIADSGFDLWEEL